MHLLNSARVRFQCIPVIHEVAAGIAAEYFNETSEGSKAFALVTAGPGITNVLTGVAGAWLESRELLVVAGQVKMSDLATADLRQRGIQEIDGIKIVSSITKATLQIKIPLPKSEVISVCRASRSGRPGPVFIEFCLDAQAAPARDIYVDESVSVSDTDLSPKIEEIERLLWLINRSTRPVLLIGGGVRRNQMSTLLPKLEALGMPIMTTWNGIDRMDSSHRLYWGRPNTWGQRSANILLQQADLIIALGTRLGLQQTGFNWRGFAPLAKVVQIDIDPNELSKGHPRLDLPICADAIQVVEQTTKSKFLPDPRMWQNWLNFGKEVKTLLPLNEASNSRQPGFLSPYDFIEELSSILDSKDVVIPCSSGGAFTTFMQAFGQKFGQKIVTDKGLASMGYGLSGAIGAGYANVGKRIILIEGDGGFAQNIQEIGTVAVSGLPIKMFIFDNGGYASIRMTQTNYFGGKYVGCDPSTGLGLPDWIGLFASYGIKMHRLGSNMPFEDEIEDSLRDSEPAAYLVPVDPQQTYFPKITSRVLTDGNMESNPLHIMTPDIAPEVENLVFKYLDV